MLTKEQLQAKISKLNEMKERQMMKKIAKEAEIKRQKALEIERQKREREDKKRALDEAREAKRIAKQKAKEEEERIKAEKMAKGNYVWKYRSEENLWRYFFHNSKYRDNYQISANYAEWDGNVLYVHVNYRVSFEPSITKIERNIYKNIRRNKRDMVLCDYRARNGDEVSYSIVVEYFTVMDHRPTEEDAEAYYKIIEPLIIDFNEEKDKEYVSDAEVYAMMVELEMIPPSKQWKRENKYHGGKCEFEEDLNMSDEEFYE